MIIDAKVYLCSNHYKEVESLTKPAGTLTWLTRCDEIGCGEDAEHIVYLSVMVFDPAGAGSKGGKASSEEKKAAARENGKKGGRPRGSTKKVDLGHSP